MVYWSLVKGKNDVLQNQYHPNGLMEGGQSIEELRFYYATKRGAKFTQVIYDVPRLFRQSLPQINY